MIGTKSENGQAEVIDQCVRNGELLGVKIKSALLQDSVWVILDPVFKPRDKFITYTWDEVKAMADKEPEQVLAAHRVKRAFGGGRVVK